MSVSFPTPAVDPLGTAKTFLSKNDLPEVLVTFLSFLIFFKLKAESENCRLNDRGFGV